MILDLTREGQPVVPEELQKLLQEYTPLGMNSNLIFLDWSSQMDTHCYLDKTAGWQFRSVRIPVDSRWMEIMYLDDFDACK